jgi:dolichol-phosphate mannosyltransferase
VSRVKSLLKIAKSPCHQADLKLEGDNLVCQESGNVYPIIDGIPSLTPESIGSRESEKNSCDVSVLIMTRDEAGNIGGQLESTTAVLKDLDISFELLVVDGHSSDNTVEEALSAGAKVERQNNPGYGNAFRQGLAMCQGKWILTLDADGSHDPNFIRSVWTHREEAEVIIASRYAEGDARMPLSRLVMSKLLNKFMGRLLSMPVKDLSSGYRLYRRSVIKELQLVSQDFNVLIELLAKLYLKGYQVLEVPFFYKPRGEGRSKASLVRFARSYLRSGWRLWRLRNSIEAADYDGRAYRSLIYPQRYWQQKRFKIITGMLGQQTNSILDVGCGSSKIIQSLPGAVGVDYNISKLRYLRKYHTQLIHGSVFGLPFADETFKTVVCSQVIEHIPDTTRAVSELLRVLKPGGELILGTPDYAGWQWPIIERIYERVIPGGYAEEHITHLTRDGMVAMVEDLGTEYLGEDFILKAEWVGHFRKHK